MKKILLISILTISNLVFSQTSSVGNGDWNAGPSWDTGVAPLDNGDTVFIEAGDLITLNLNTTYTLPLVIIVRGILKLDATLSLPSGSIITVDSGGVVTSGNNGWRLDIGASTWGGLKNNPITSGIITDIALSIKKLEFSSELHNEQDIRFSWIVELGNDDLIQIEIESSLNGKTFSTLQEVELNQNNGEVIVNSGSETYITYYRMKVVDVKDVTYSEVQKVINDNFKMKIYPNPFKEEINMTSFSEMENIKISIINILGTEVFRSSGFTSSINTSELSEGIYFVNIFQNDVLMQRQRILKK